METITQIPKVEAANFAKAWTYKGVALFFDDAHLQFATDFANVVLRSFILDCKAKAMAAEQASKVLTTD